MITTTDVCKIEKISIGGFEGGLIEKKISHLSPCLVPITV